MKGLKNTCILGSVVPNVDIRKFPPHFGGCGYYIVLEKDVYLTPSNIWVQGKPSPELVEGVNEKKLKEVLKGIEGTEAVFPVMLYGVDDPREYYRNAWAQLFDAVVAGKELRITERIYGKLVFVAVTTKPPLQELDFGSDYVVQELFNPFPVEDVWAFMFNMDEKNGIMTQTNRVEFPYGVLNVLNPGIASIVEEWLR